MLAPSTAAVLREPRSTHDREGLDGASDRRAVFLLEHPELVIDAGRTVVTARCFDCDWVGSSVDDARRHARQVSHNGFRTFTQLVSAAGRLVDERVEVHQL